MSPVHWNCNCGMGGPCPMHPARNVVQTSPDPVPSLSAGEMREAKYKEALREAVGAMVRSMMSDESTDAPYDEDMAQAIGSCYRALGEPDKADKWYRLDVDRGVS